MPNRFSSFADFLNALKSHYRQNIKRTRQKSERAGYRAVHLEDPTTLLRVYTPEVHRLYEAVVSRSDVRLEVLPLGFFHELVRQFPGRVALTTIYREERIVAFGWSLAAGREYHCLFGGIDYSLNDDGQLYFNMVYETLDHAFQRGGEVIRVGQTADAFKTNLGCSGKPRYFYVRGTGPMTSWLLQRFAGHLFPPRPALPSHDVFKATAKVSELALASR
jgi:predicted N-acyltransferase